VCAEFRLVPGGLTKLQSDSAFLGSSAAIPAGTYTNMVVGLSNPVVTYCTQTQGITGCAPASVKTLSTGGPATPSHRNHTIPSNSNGRPDHGLAVNLDLGKALAVNPQTQAITNVNLGAANVLGATVLPPVASNLPSSALDFGRRCNRSDYVGQRARADRCGANGHAGIHYGHCERLDDWSRRTARRSISETPLHVQRRVKSLASI